jgi:hypothetical protein
MKFPFALPGWVILFALAFAIAIDVSGRASQTEDKSADEMFRMASDDDCKILELVLVNLIDYDQFRRMTLASKTTKIVLESKSQGSERYVNLADDQLNREGHMKEPYFISPEVRENLRWRNRRKPVSLRRFVPASANVVVAGLTESDLGRFGTFRQKHPEAGGYVQAWLPGYSKDGQSAVIRAFIGPTFHSTTVTYGVAKDKGRWAVVWRTSYFTP